MKAALEHTVLANNMSAESENKIHSDAMAKQFGFEGALVGGVNVYAYMTHLPVSHYGIDWLSGGSADCRFFKPVYDGRETICSAELRPDGALGLQVQMAGVTCATGQASMTPDKTVPAIDSIPTADFPAPQDRPPGSPQSLAEGTVMGSYELKVSAAENRDYCEGARETLTLYNDEGLVHPGMLLQMANRSLAGNVLISPWIHVSSSIENHGLAHIDTDLSARGKVVKEYEHKGHKFVELDVLLVADSRDCIARVQHVAIYQPRKFE